MAVRRTVFPAVVRTRAAAVLAAALLALAPAACRHGATGPSGATPVSGTPTVVPDWTNGAVCYEVFVRSFYDSDGDGIGDLNGLTEKLDYINDGNPDSKRSLGARCIWLMPIMPSPSYHGYDITDYYRINPQYGTMADFQRFLAEAHRRGIKVLIDLVLNHTSSQHPDFQAALHDPSSPYRNWYIFSPLDPGTVAPWGAPAWHRSPVRNEFYYGIFSDAMPDLDYTKQPARDEAKKIAAYWLTQIGVDGFRLDAVPYLIEQGNQLRDTPATHEFLREYAAYLYQIDPEVFTVGEIWDSIDLFLTYYPDQLGSNFSFALAADLLAAAGGGSGRALVNDYLRVLDAVPANRFAPFLSNHDQTRTMTVLGFNVPRAKLAATLLLTLPGIPFVYYGEEIGMSGDKPDERIRTPMQWSAAPGAGFTSGTPWEPLQGNWQTTNVAAQDADSTSLLNLYRRLIHLRAADAALGTGTLVALDAGTTSVTAYLRQSGGETMLVVANLAAGRLTGVTLSSGNAAVLSPGDYTATDVLGGPAAATLHIGSDGRIQGYVPFATLDPVAAHVLELSTRQ